MAQLVFVDTSILCVLLQIRGKSEDRSKVVQEFEQRQGEGAVFVIPIAAVVETGNHIAQLPDGHDRESRSRALKNLLDRSLAGTHPWVVSGVAWDHVLVRSIIDGGASAPDLVQAARSHVGTGDPSILAEMRAFAARTETPSALPVELWTLDAGLKAFTWHSVHYTRLPDRLVVLDVWESQAGFWLPHERDDLVRPVGLSVPPTLFRGVLRDEATLAGLLGPSAFADGALAEGAVCRAGQDRCKVVADGFVRRPDERWTDREHNALAC